MQVKKAVLSLDLEYLLLGISTSAPPHKLVYYLNKDLNISFNREEDINFLENQKVIYLNKYTYYESQTEQDWTLISNQSKIKSTKIRGEEIFQNESEVYTLVYLIPELKMFDYILKIDGVLKKEEKISQMNNILILNVVSEINQSLIKNKDKLLF